MATNIFNHDTISLEVNFTSAPRMPSAQTASIWLGAFVVLGFLILVVNMLTIAATFLKTRLRMYCIVNLAIADLLRGILSTAYQIYGFVLYINDPYHSSSNVLRDLGNAVVFPVVLSLLSLVLVALERVFAAFFSMRYRNITLKHYLVAFGIIWSTAFIAFLIFHFHHHVTNNSTILTFSHLVIKSIFVLSPTLIIGSYTAVYIKMHQNAKAQRQRQLPGVVMQRAKKERHFAMTLFIVTAVYLTTWIPYIIVRLIYSFPILFIGLFKIIPNIISATFFINIANSLINPVVYVFRLKDFREAVFSLVCSFSLCKRKVEPVSTTSNIDNQPRGLPTNVIALTPRDF